MRKGSFQVRRSCSSTRRPAFRATRSSNEAGEYSFPGVVARHLHSAGRRLSGFKKFERKDARIGTQQFLTLDIVLEVGAIEETITVAAEAPLIETSNASTGDVLDKTTLETLPSISRMAFLASNTVPTVTYTGNPHMNRMQDQTEASRMSLGGGISVGNNYLLDGYSDHRHAEPRVHQPEHRDGRRRQGPGAHLRRRDGPHRRRDVQRERAIRDQPVPRLGILADAAPAR